MTTLLQSINEFIENISVTDRQEDNISASVKNLTDHLEDSDNDLHVEEVFTNGSYERETNLRPLDDIDLFAVLDRESWQDQYGTLPNPQSVLSRIKNFLNDLHDYKGKVKQDRPCVTIRLSDKDFDVLPSFPQVGGGYLIPNHDLKSWIDSYPKKLTDDLNNIHKARNYKVKSVIKAVKSWNRDNDKVIPSFHIEETDINIFQVNNFKNLEEGIRLWFENAEYQLLSLKFRSNNDYTASLKKVKKVKEKLKNACELLDEKKESEAIQIWKDIFGKEFPSVDIEEARAFSKSLSEGTLKIGSTGVLSTISGKAVPASKGMFGDEAKS